MRPIVLAMRHGGDVLVETPSKRIMALLFL
jgi:hypothetical protein